MLGKNGAEFMCATCYVIWIDGSHNHFSFFYEKNELTNFSSFYEFVVAKCLLIFPGRTREEIKWIIKED